MIRKYWVVLLAMVTLGLAGTDLSACGDKFLRVGRSARFRAYASVHPSSILLYARGWTPRGIADFEQMLKRGGHTPVTVKTSGELTKAFVGAHYEVIITNYADAPVVNKEIDALPSKPALLPLVYKASKTQAAEASAAYQCLLKPEKMTPIQALQEIDRLIDLRLKTAGPRQPGS